MLIISVVCGMVSWTWTMGFFSFVYGVLCLGIGELILDQCAPGSCIRNIFILPVHTLHMK